MKKASEDGATKVMDVKVTSVGADQIIGMEPLLDKQEPDLKQKEHGSPIPKTHEYGVSTETNVHAYSMDPRTLIRFLPPGQRHVSVGTL